jgi:putative SOS response-associated peptidase YedK
MCGRYVASTPTAALASEFEVDEVAEAAQDAPPSFNVAPTDPVPGVAVNRAGARVLGRFRWGLVPSWATDTRDAARRINARAETLVAKPAFRNAISRRRCLLPADGFYEWERRGDGSKQAWFIHRSDGRSMAMAGLWEVWSPGEDQPLLRTCSVITTAANDMMGPVHSRMPVVLERDAWSVWLDRAMRDPADVDHLLVPAGEATLTRRPVSALVNSVQNNGPELIEAADPTPPAPVPLRLL